MNSSQNDEEYWWDPWFEWRDSWIESHPLAYTLLHFFAPFIVISLLGVAGIVSLEHAVVFGFVYGLVYCLGRVMYKGYPPTNKAD